jgi:hypothetical protein
MSECQAIVMGKDECLMSAMSEYQAIAMGKDECLMSAIMAEGRIQ